MSGAAALAALVAAELAQTVDPRVAAMAAAIAAQHPGARAVLFYGSCLRERQLDGLMLDFYLIVADYARAYDRTWLATANRRLPPNVFPFQHDGLVAKYAVLSEADFHRLNGPEADNVSVWARFAQPSRLAWTADAAAGEAATTAVARAAPTLFALTLPMMDEPAADVLAVWRRGFALTYGAELRAERKERGGSIVDAEPERYCAFGEAALASLCSLQGRGRGWVEAGRGARAVTTHPNPSLAGRGLPEEAALRWRRLQKRGKRLTLARLAKASLTYAGGIDYLAWKINRHADAGIVIAPWQRRWPILGAITLLPQLFRRGSIR